MWLHLRKSAGLVVAVSGVLFYSAFAQNYHAKETGGVSIKTGREVIASRPSEMIDRLKQ